MLDPLTSLSVASNIAQLVQFGFKVVETASELSERGTTRERAHLRKLAADTKTICIELDQQLGPVPDQNPQDQDHAGPVFSLGIDSEQFDPFRDDKDSKSPTLVPRKAQSIDPSSEAVRALSNDTQTAATELEELLGHIDLNKPDPDDVGLAEALQNGSKRRRLTADRTRRIAASLFKGLTHDQRLNQTRRRLQDLQTNMILRLVAVQSISQTALLKSLHPFPEELMKQRDRRLTACKKTLPRIQHYAVCTEEERERFASQLENLEEQLRTTSKIQRILKTLVFHEVYSREDAIPDAHANTFSWIFEKETTSLSEWASSKSGVFWITGKPGCGKSTLMKYIVQDCRTSELLQQWAGADELVVAHHYFWSAGTSMQRSQVGLLRTLLYHIIQQSADLALECLPHRFHGHLLDGVVPWTYKELCQAILKFGQRKRQGVRLCFFIDGLDEYEGEPMDLISLISTISESPCIKVCVSSRPWNAFTRAYHKRVDGELEVQELTANDIGLYVNNKINDNRLFSELRDQDEANCALLVQSIIDKAQGVFLWVYLVVRSLTRGITNGDDLRILHRRLNSYPDNLDGYFQRMFDRIESFYLMESSRLMITALAAEKSLPFWGPRCIELEMENPDYAIAISVPPSLDDTSLIYGCDCGHAKGHFSFASDARSAVSTLPTLENADEVNHNCYYLLGEGTACQPFTSGQREKLRTYLDARCADLLEVHPDGVGFIHRTAKDFLAQSDLSLKLYALAGSEYDVALSLARLAVVDAKRESRLKFFNLQCLDRTAVLQFRDQIKETNVTAYDRLIDHLEEICTGPQTDGTEESHFELTSGEDFEHDAIARLPWVVADGNDGLVSHVKEVRREELQAG